MTTGLSKYSSCLTWTLIGALIVGVALASITTLYIREKSISTDKTTCTTISSGSTCQTSSSLTYRQPYYCGNSTSYTLWQLFLTDGITMTIDTSICNFNATPIYFTSMAGISYHWVATGYTAIYSASQNTFTVYAHSATYPNNTQLLYFSQFYQWSINWYGLLD
ncbi:hypothetical protein I4U23_013300 [Adineta vaga]|nr:hypothetical protein I4U23_013300 [Adineta vaga]